MLNYFNHIRIRRVSDDCKWAARVPVKYEREIHCEQCFDAEKWKYNGTVEWVQQPHTGPFSKWKQSTSLLHTIAHIVTGQLLLLITSAFDLSPAIYGINVHAATPPLKLSMQVVRT